MKLTKRVPALAAQSSAGIAAGAFTKLSGIGLAVVLSLSLCCVSLLSQTVIADAIRVGSVAKELIARDLAELQDLLPAGSKPWLLIGYTTQRFYEIEAYLRPETTTSNLRRGKMIVFLRQAYPPDSRPWRIGSSTEPGNPADQSYRRNGDYVQVSLPGRNFNDVRDEHDTNRPFRVEGHFDDSELASIVRFLRSSPSLGFAFPSTWVNKTELWPVEGVYRTAGEVIVWFHFKSYSSRRLNLRRAGETWVITASAAPQY